MKPSPCRFVLYCFRNRGEKKLTERPALVTSVRGDDSINIHVFFEPEDSDECARGQSGDLDFDPRYEASESKTGEPEQNTWRWPPRV